LLLLWLAWDSRQFTYAGITGRRSVLIAFGLALGIVNQRTRFCIVRAFREPFMTGDAAMTKATALALVVGVLGFAVIKGSDLSDVRNVSEFVNPSVWLGSLSGGVLFGIGMVLAGGCGAGSLWRAGEGQIKLWLVLLVFSVSSALFAQFLRATGLRERWGDQAYFVPDLLGWAGGLLLLLAIPVAWYGLAAWNERRGTFVVP
ncbi:MAG TPA: YeeE/YedE thiosulfate transporter family protein, partial [bacterium]|nr:YeeE/YedE thiosulfate transporter family protein [bacterium]